MQAPQGRPRRRSQPSLRRFRMRGPGDHRRRAACRPAPVIAPYAMHEECTRLGAGDRLDYRYDSSAPVDFDIHYHEDNAPWLPSSASGRRRTAARSRRPSPATIACVASRTARRDHRLPRHACARRAAPQYARRGSQLRVAVRAAMVDRRRAQALHQLLATVRAARARRSAWKPLNSSTLGSRSFGCARANACIAVSMMPGRTVIARNRGDMCSAASERVSISSPALADAVQRLAGQRRLRRARRHVDDPPLDRTSSKTRQNRLASTIGATRLTAIDAAMSDASAVPSTPTGSSVAALLIRHSVRGASWRATASNAGADDHRRSSTSAEVARDEPVALAARGAADDERPIPSTRHSRASELERKRLAEALAKRR